MEDEDKITHSLRQELQPPDKIGGEKCAAGGDSSKNLVSEVNAVEVAAGVVEIVGEGEKCAAVGISSENLLTEVNAVGVVAEVVEIVGEGEKCAAVGGSSENLLLEVNAVEVAAEVVESVGEGVKMEEVDGEGVELREEGSEAGRNEGENVEVLVEEDCALRVEEGRGNVKESVEGSVSVSEGEDGGGVNVEGRGNVVENVEVSVSEGKDGGVNVEGVGNVEVLVLEGKDGGVNVEGVENVEVSMSEGKGGDVGGALKVMEEEERRNEGGIVGELRLEGGVGVVEGVERGEVKVGGEGQGGERVDKGEVIVGGEGGEGAGKGDAMVVEEGGEGGEKRDAMVAEEGGEGAEKRDAMVAEEGGEGAEKRDAMVAEEGGNGAEKRDAMVVEEGGERVEKEGVVGEEEDSEATGDGEVSPRSIIVAEVASKEETPIVDMEMEFEVTKSESGSGSGGKRRRGRIPKASASVKVPARQTVGEDVCFICLDGGNLVLCDRRACPKAYHPSCVDHDEEFFKTKGRWNCGWHICNQCGKNAYFYCYTCTFSMCKGCSKKDAVFFCVKGSKGFCETCMKSVMMIESSEPNATGLTAFDDKRNWEYLFKDYWIEQKAKLSISSEELAQAKNPLKDSGMTGREKALVELPKATNNAGTDSDSSLANIDMHDTKRKRAKRKLKPVDSDTDSSSEKEVGQARKKNRRSKSQAKEASSDSEYSTGYQGLSSKRGKRAKRLSKSRSKSGGISSRGNVEWASVELMEFVMHMKNGDRSVLAPFDVQSLLLEYISRNKLRDPRRQSQILCDSMLQKLFGKPRVGHFEMLKLLESHFLLKEDAHLDNNQGSIVDTEISQLDADDHTDLYLDSGKSWGKKSRKRGEARGQSNLDDYAAIDMHNINLIYLRRCLMESLMDDSEMFHDKVVGSFIRIRISGSSQKQDIYRLVQIIGTTKAPQPYKVGKRTTDVMLEILNLDKTEIVAIDTISNQEFTEDECKRLRQSIKCGLISCMTVGDVLKKARDLQAVRVSDWLEAEVLRLGHLRDRASEKGRKKELRECVEKLQLLKTPEERQRRLDQIPEVHADPKMDPSCESDDENELHANNVRLEDSGFVRRGREHFLSRHGISVSNDSWSGNAKPPNKTRELGRNSSGKNFSNRRDDNNNPSQTSEHTRGNGVEKGTPSSNSREKLRVIPDTSMSTREEQSGTQSDLSKAVPSESLQPLPSPANQTDVKVNETEKAWHYRDPTSKVQGPFSMAQLRKWSHTGYFPIDLRIWKISQTEDDSILLMEALVGRFRKESCSVGSTLSSMDTSKISSGRYDSSSLPSPTPSRITDALNGKQTSGSFQLSNQFQGNERLPSPTPTSPSDISHQQKGDLVVKKHENVASSTGASQSVSGQFVLNSGPIKTQHMSAQPVAHVKNQPFIPPDSAMNQTNVGQNISGTGQGFSNMTQPGNGKNQAAYSQSWGTGFVTRPETVNANLTPNNALPVKVPYNQWTGAPLSNSSPYAAGFGSPYPPGQANVAANLPSLLVNNAWRPPAQTNMPWGAQQQPVNQNVGWAGPPGAMSQSSSGIPAMGAGATTVGLTGTGPSPSAGNTEMVWATASGSASTRGGDQNHNGGGGQRNLQSSSGSGGQRVCKYFREHGHCRKGSLCDYMHT